MFGRLVGQRTQILSILWGIGQVAIAVGLPIPAVVLQVILALAGATAAAKVNRLINGGK